MILSRSRRRTRVPEWHRGAIAARRNMSRLRALLSSGIGRKVLMGATGLLLIAFLIAHMSANLLVLFDANAYNNYSEHLVTNPLIYLAEAALVAFFVSHLVAGILFYRRNREAR